MTELIQISTNQDGRPAVSGRELHEFLGVKKDFTDWAKIQVERASLIEGQDYEVFLLKGVNPHGGRPSVDYIFSIAASKEICMMSGCERGKQARQHFIECERKLQTFQKAPTAITGNDLIKIGQEMNRLNQRLVVAEQKIEADKPKVLFADAVTASSTSISVAVLAKMICQNGFEIGEKRLFAWLRKNGYLCNCGGQRNIPTQRAIKAGLFEIETRRYKSNDGRPIAYEIALVTRKGQIYFLNRFHRDKGVAKHRVVKSAGNTSTIPLPQFPKQDMTPQPETKTMTKCGKQKELF